VTKHPDYFVCKDTSERVTRRFDDTVDNKRVKFCVLKYLFVGAEQPKKSPKIPGNAISDALLMPLFENLAADAAKKKLQSFLKLRFA